MASSRVSLDARREQLISATILEMREKGVRSITTRSVAKRAEASLATLHYCFENMDALIHAAVEQWLANMVEYGPGIQSNLSFGATVEAFAARYWDELERHPDDVLAQLEIVVWAAREDDSTNLRERIYTGYEDELSALFAAAFEREHLNREFDGRAFLRMLLAIMDGCSLQFILQPELPVHRSNFFLLVRGAISTVTSAQ